MKLVVVGGGIAGLAAAHRLVTLLPEAHVVVVERGMTVGGKVVTERTLDGFVIEGAADSFLSRKDRGVGLCEELGLGDELIGRRPECARSYVRRGHELHQLPEGLTGMIPTNLDALAESALLSPAGRERLAQEVSIPSAPPGGDESIASFVSRRLGDEAYERLVEPLMTGIYGGDGEQLSLQATFPQLRILELEHGSILRGLQAQTAGANRYPPFVTLASGMDTIVGKLTGAIEGRGGSVVESVAVRLSRRSRGFVVELNNGVALDADGVVIAVPAFAAAPLFAEIDFDLSAAHAEIPYASSAVVTLAYEQENVEHELDGYGYVVPRSEGTESSPARGRRASGKGVLHMGKCSCASMPGGSANVT